MKYSTAYHQLLFKEEISISIGDETVNAYHTLSHTLDHIDIYLEQSNVLFMSDGFQPHWLTYAGPNEVDSVVSGIDKAISLSDDHTIIVPGNTPKDPKYYFGNKKQLIRNRKIYIQLNQQVGALDQKGHTVEDMVSNKRLNNIIRDLEAYSVKRPYLKYYIMEMLEVDNKKSPLLSKEALASYQRKELKPIEVYLIGDRLYARQEGVFHFELDPASNKKFDLKGYASNDYFEFHFSPTGQVESMTPMLEPEGWWSQIIPVSTYHK